MKKHSSDVHRLLMMITLLQSSRPQDGYNARRLAAELGVAERTVYRDIEKLQGVGIPVLFDRSAGVYRIDGAFFLPPIELTAEEALALSALVEHIAEPERIAFLRSAHRALAKVQAALPGPLREEVAAQLDHMYIQTAPASPPDGCVDVYDRVREAMRQGRALRCVYEPRGGSGKAGETGGEPFLFEPYTLFFSVRSWYAIGRHGGRDGVRSLKLQRFASIELTDERYEIPGGFSLRAHLGNAWRMIRGEPECEVEIRFDPDFADTVAETLWHPTQEIEEHEDGSATFRCTVAGLDEIVWWVLSMGPHARVIKPAELSKRVRELAEETARVYAANAAKR